MSRVRVPVFATVKETYALLLVDFVALLRAAWAPSIGMVVLNALVLQADIEAMPPMAILLLVLGYLVLFVAMAMAYVRWHRFVILGETEHDRPQFAFRREEWRYVLSWLVIPLLAAGLAVLVGPLTGGLAIVIVDALGAFPDVETATLFFTTCQAGGALCAIYVALRLSMGIPNAAIRGALELRAMWRATQGNFWRIFAVILITSVPPLAIAFASAYYFAGALEGAEGLVMTPIEAWWNGLLGLLASMIMVVAQSIIYIRLVELPRARSGLAATEL